MYINLLIYSYKISIVSTREKKTLKLADCDTNLFHGYHDERNRSSNSHNKVRPAVIDCDPVDYDCN